MMQTCHTRGWVWSRKPRSTAKHRIWVLPWRRHIHGVTKIFPRAYWVLGASLGSKQKSPHLCSGELHLMEEDWKWTEQLSKKCLRVWNACRETKARWTAIRKLRKEGRVEEVLRPERSILAGETVRMKALGELGWEERAGPPQEKHEANECAKE